MSVSAFNAEEIQSAGILRPQDFIALTPNMTMVQTQNQGTSFIVVRGISQARNSEPSVAVLIDGVLMANPSQFNQELFDIASIEVLKGPQGALYGRNAIGGAVIIHDAEPGDEIEGSVMAGYDSGPGYTARFGVGGPIGGSDAWKFQLSRLVSRHRRLHRQPVPRRGGGPVQGRVGRAQAALGAERQLSGATSAFRCRRWITQALYFNITEQVDDTSLPVRVNNPGENERDLMSASLKLDFDVGGGTLTSVTAYDTIEELLTGDQFDFLPIPESVLFQFFGFGPGAAPVARRRGRKPGDPLHVAGRRAGSAGFSAPTSSRPTGSSRPATCSTSARAKFPRRRRRHCRCSRRSSPSWPTPRTTSPGPCSAK